MNLRKSSATTSAQAAVGHNEVRAVVGMRRWLRLTARKHSVAKATVNDSSKAAAEALEAMLGSAGRRG